MRGILVATSPEGVIGKNNTIPWYYSEDVTTAGDWDSQHRPALLSLIHI